MGEPERVSRHKWIKLRTHVYICRVCGTGKVNSQDGGGWQTTYHTPDGYSRVLTKTPRCAPDIFTAQYLAKYAAEIAAGGIRDDREIIR